ncbi:hypothetical protein BofuT4_P126420.1 [Botrytis cinerea T4]|uniref:Uncharacterized protein n=1 Tax=Botryotinia fuckeliana (strain T4) TaxID=999810 RepID=G2YSJ6_BOTF4|nr:hypothetical protein BofuT4_P126420.1 [Botrytis cinerea T4]
MRFATKRRRSHECDVSMENRQFRCAIALIEESKHVVRIPGARFLSHDENCTLAQFGICQVQFIPGELVPDDCRLWNPITAELKIYFRICSTSERQQSPAKSPY